MSAFKYINNPDMYRMIRLHFDPESLSIKTLDGIMDHQELAKLYFSKYMVAEKYSNIDSLFISEPNFDTDITLIYFKQLELFGVFNNPHEYDEFMTEFVKLDNYSFYSVILSKTRQHFVFIAEDNLDIYIILRQQLKYGIPINNSEVETIVKIYCDAKEGYRYFKELCSTIKLCKNS